MSNDIEMAALTMEPAEGESVMNWMKKVAVRRAIWVAICKNYPTADPDIFAGCYEEVLEMAAKWWVRQGESYDPEAPPSEVWGKEGVKAMALGGVWAEVSNFLGPEGASILFRKARQKPVDRYPDGTIKKKGCNCDTDKCRCGRHSAHGPKECHPGTDWSKHRKGCPHYEEEKALPLAVAVHDEIVIQSVASDAAHKAIADLHKGKLPGTKIKAGD